MSRLIDVEFAEREITDYKRMQTASHYPTSAECKAVWHGMELAIKVLHNCPTIDAEPVVRCKDCEHYQTDVLFNRNYCCGRLRKPEDYCSYGAKMGEKGGDV